MKNALSRITAASLGSFFLVLSMPLGALASSVGILKGTVVDASTGSPIGNAQIAASASTGTYKTTTDSRGFYVINGVYADTYTVSFKAEGYRDASYSGVTVFADQTQTEDVKLVKALRTIANVTSRSQGGAFQPNQTADTYTVTTNQINTIQGNALNVSETNLITSLPGASADSFGYPVIHGGRENEEGFEFEGIPYTDAFTNQFTNSLALPGLGVKSAQLTPGAGSAEFGDNGTGTLNLVAKRGSYPSYFNAQVAVGGGQYYHALNLEYGTASPNGRWSEYAAFAGGNTSPLYGGENAPDATEILAFGNELTQSDREFMNNLFYRWGKNQTQSLQLFLDLADHTFYTGNYGGNPYCFMTCDPEFLGAVSSVTGVPEAEVSQLTGLDPYQTSRNELLSQTNRAPYTFFQPNAAYKLEYANALSPSTYVSAKYYYENNVTTFDAPNYAWEDPFQLASITPQGGITRGGTISLTKQLNDKNSLQFGADYAYLHPYYRSPMFSYGVWDTVAGVGIGNNEIYDFIPANSPNCPSGVSCGYLSQYFPNGIPAIPPNLEQSATNRQDFSLFAKDTIDFSTRFKAEIGLRVDGANYQLPAPVVDPATCTTLYLPATWTGIDANGNVNGKPIGPGNCPTATFNVPNSAIHPRIPEPRLAFTYNPTPNDSFRMTYGRSLLLPTLATMDAYVDPSAYTAFSKIPSYSNFNGGGPALCGQPGYQVPCVNYGEQLMWDAYYGFEGVAIQPVKPETFNNYQVTWQHQFTRGFLNGVSFSVAPWYRRGYNAIASVQSPLLGSNGKPITNPDGTYVYNPPVQTNDGWDFATGVDMRITRETEYGLSGQMAVTYINEFSNVIPLSSSEDFYPSIPPASLALGNIYRVGFISPLQASLDLSYATHNGWRFSPQINWNIGYPIGAGTVTAAFINGVPTNIPNTNASGAISTAPNGASCYVDPLNPGSYLNPNVDACRGTPEGSSAGGKLSNPIITANFTAEYNINAKDLIGFTVDNFFNALYPGAYFYGFNDRYQPVATGLAGPLTGYSTDPYVYPGQAAAGYGSPSLYAALIRGRDAFLNPPNALGRSYYIYFQTKV